MDHERRARQPRSDSARTGDESTEPHDHHRPMLAHDAERLNERVHEPERRHQQRADALAAQAAHRQPLDREAVLRDDASFEAALRAEPDHVELASAQQTRERERGEDVSAGAASHDDDGTGHFVVLLVVGVIVVEFCAATAAAGAAAAFEPPGDRGLLRVEVADPRPLTHRLVIHAQEHPDPSQRDDRNSIGHSS